MKKLTLVLVALLLALTCVFVACGKKTDTPVDDNPKQDEDPTVVETVPREDLVKIAEAFNVAYAENFVDLYASDVAVSIEAAKSAAIL